jgi:hypothetical protein
MKLKRIIIFLLFFIFILHNLTSSSIADLVLQSDRHMNKEIIDLIFSEDYETVLSIMRALGRRKDSYVGDIIQAVLSTYTGSESYKYENMLEELLSYLFDPADNRGSLRERFDQNKTALTQLITQLPHIHSPCLKQQIIRLIPRAGTDVYHALLAREAEYIASLLENNNGYVDKATDQELITLLEVVSTLNITECAEICLTISSVSGNRDVVHLARKVAKSLLAE